jgi:hypothetical protein
MRIAQVRSRGVFCAFVAWNMEEHVLCFCSMEYGIKCSVLLQHGIWNNMFCAFVAWNMEKHVLFVLVKHLSLVPLLTLCLSCLQGEASQNSTAKGVPHRKGR